MHGVLRTGCGRVMHYDCQVAKRGSGTGRGKELGPVRVGKVREDVGYSGLELRERPFGRPLAHDNKADTVWKQLLSGQSFEQHCRPVAARSMEFLGHSKPLGSEHVSGASFELSVRKRADEGGDLRNIVRRILEHQPRGVLHLPVTSRVPLGKIGEVTHRC